SDLWWRPVVPSGITESRCMAGTETKPALEARSVAHHANTSFRGGTITRAGFDADDGDAAAPGGGGGGQLSECAMGKIGGIIPPDACRMAPPNGSVSWDIHFYPNGQEVKGATVSVGIWLHPPGHEPKYRNNLSLYG